MRVVLFMIFGLFACSRPAQLHSAEAVPETVKTDSSTYYFALIDSAKADEYELERAKKYFVLEDSLVRSSPKRLMQAGLVLMSGEKDYLYGINYLITLTKKYPNDPYAPEALMQLALFFENRLGDREKSVIYLRSLLDRYPSHELASQAEALLMLSPGNELNTIQNWLNNN